MVFTPFNLLVLLAGTLFGLILGVLPGIGPIQGIAILLPLTYSMDALSSIILLGAIFSASMYGGMITSILIGTPGEPSTAMTVLDGFPMTKKGQAGVAIGAGTFVSLLSAIAGLLLLSFVAPPVARFAVRFGPPEFFLLATLGLLVISAAVKGNVVKGLLSAALGMLLSTVGFSPILGAPRYTFGLSSLEDGIPFVDLTIGLFAVAEVLFLLAEQQSLSVAGRIAGGMLEGFKATLRYPVTVVRSILIGLGIGVLPGIGAVTANMLGYLAAVRASKHPERFGTGEVEGVIASEAANNAVVGASMVPMLTLGIPGGATTAILVGALTMQGLFPGPRLFAEHRDLVYAFFASLFLAQIAWFVIGLGLTRVWAWLATIPLRLLVPFLLAIALYACYIGRQDPFDVYLTVVLGICSYFLRRNGFSPVPVLMSFVLFPLAETSFHQTMLMSGDSLAIFVQRPYSIGILVVLAAILVVTLLQGRRSRRGETPEAADTSADTSAL